MSHQSHAFGLDLTLPWAIPGLPPRRAAPGRPVLTVTVGGAVDADRAWGESAGRRVVELPGRGARPELVVRAAGDRYRLDWHAIGRFVLPGDGRLVCAVEPGADAQWERLLLAQVLPLAATVAGVEVLHAGAVAVDGMALGIVGAGGMGKSTLACALADQGAEFMADDALGLTRDGATITAHPGPALARLAAAPGQTPDVAGKAVRELGARAEARELGALFLLRRAADVGAPAFHHGAGFPELAGATFNLLVQTPERLRRQLDLCADLDASGRVWRVELPASMAAADAASLIARHVREVAPWVGR